jgi:ABC-2 type transport system ATP-binding protein
LVELTGASIVVESLVKTFARRGQPVVRAIDDLSFTVARGSIFGLLGPNGAGKTTTLRVLTTLTRPTRGSVAIEGFDVSRQPLEVRRRIAVVIQEQAAELFLTVRDSLATYGRFHGLAGTKLAARVERAIEEFGLAAEASRKVMDLSGGFRRRVQVAKVFVVETPVLFLDEFSTGMDPILKRSVMARLRSEAAAGRTIVLTTQILTEAEELCDDILILDHGRQAARGDLHTLKLLASGVHEVTVTYADLPTGIEEELRRLDPLRLEIVQNTIVLALKGSDIGVLDLLPRLAAKGEVLRLEVSGASLEDVFLELTGAAGDPRASGASR